MHALSHHPEPPLPHESLRVVRVVKAKVSIFTINLKDSIYE